MRLIAENTSGSLCGDRGAQHDGSIFGAIAGENLVENFRYMLRQIFLQLSIAEVVQT